MKCKSKPTLSPKELANVLGDAAANYRSNRKRIAIYTFLHIVYTHYWKIRKSRQTARYREGLELILGPNSERRLSQTLLLVASNEFDRREIHRWKGILECCYSHKIEPEQFVAELKSYGGVNAALKAFAKPILQKDQPQLWPETPSKLISLSTPLLPSSQKQKRLIASSELPKRAVTVSAGLSNWPYRRY